MADPFFLIGIGEILWDTFPDYRELGGAPANFAFHANVLGNKGLAVSRIGDDPDGNAIKEHLERLKVPHRLTEDPDHPTGKVTVKTDEKGIPEYIIHENAAWDFLSFEPEFKDLAAKADAVCYGTLAQRSPVTGETIQKFIRATRKDCLKILDINLRQHYFSKAVIRDLLELSNILKLNHEELDVISDMFSIPENETERLDALVRQFKLDLIVLTRGSNGSRLFVDKGQDSVYKSEPVQIEDTVGAGDAFTAVVATGWLKQMELGRINRLANDVAAFVCTKKGATPRLPDDLIQPLN